MTFFKMPFQHLQGEHFTCCRTLYVPHPTMIVIRYFQEALRYPENSMESIVYRGAAAYVEFMFSHFL